MERPHVIKVHNPQVSLYNSMKSPKTIRILHCESKHNSNTVVCKPFFFRPRESRILSRAAHSTEPEKHEQLLVRTRGLPAKHRIHSNRTSSIL